jgi:hypothetical protein
MNTAQVITTLFKIISVDLGNFDGYAAKILIFFGVSRTHLVLLFHTHTH